MKNKLRFVVDTNVLISAVLVPHGKARQALTKADRNGFLLISTETFAELKGVIYRKKFDVYITDRDRERVLRDLLGKAILVQPTEKIVACADPKDDKFLEVALSGQADYIITGNTKDFPPDSFRGIPILKPAAFLAHDLSVED